MDNCNVCSSKPEVVFRSAEELSITTMNRLVPGRTELYYCNKCSHLQTKEILNLEDYYRYEYEISANSSDDDQLYKIMNGVPVYRSVHQGDVFLEKVKPQDGARILDYGCGKALALKRIKNTVPSIKPYAFDVTDKYIKYWQEIDELEGYAAINTDPAWEGLFDVILSYYALEHIADLSGSLEKIKSLLKPGGTFYFVVPNVQKNIADFIVGDHVNHFSADSLTFLMRKNGFSDVEVDDVSHDAAFVVIARHDADAHEFDGQIEIDPDYRQRIEEMSEYWRTIATRITTFVDALPPREPIAIYGAGFYGNYIASLLDGRNEIACFVDQNPHLIGTSLLSKPIVSPVDLPDTVSNILIGLNPLIARDAIADIDAWANSSLNYQYL